MVPDLRLAVQRIGSVVVPLPTYQTPGSAGMDLHAALGRPIVLAPLERVKVPTGLIFAIPESFEGQIRTRSGLAASAGLTVLNSPGTIDSDYRGEVQVLLINLGSAPVTVAPLDRIAQLVIAPVARAELVEVPQLSATARGAGGYGSTGLSGGVSPFSSALNAPHNPTKAEDGGTDFDPT
jgi:dUTP pyrophosphatase